MISTTTVGPSRSPRAPGAYGRKVLSVMSATPQPAQPQKNPNRVAGDFEGFIDGALRDHVVGIGAPPSAADLEPRELLRYAAGKATDDERTALEDFVKRSSWAYDRVVTLVRSNRPGETGLRNQVARRLLSAGGGGRTKAVAIVGQAILEVEGIRSNSLEDAWKTVETQGSPKARAACLIGMGRHEDARKLLETQSTKDPSWSLLRRVSAAALETSGEASDDATLLAVLDALPSL
jgi:hypothetical protein